MFRLVLIAICLFVTIRAAAQSLQVTDDLGNNIDLPEAAKRIVSLAPHVTEMLYAIGAGHQVVAGVSHSDYPQAAKSLPLIGTYTKINLELLLTLKPDLVVAWYSGNGPEQINKIKSLGLPLYVTNPEVPEDIAINLSKLGRLTGNTVRAEKARSAFIEELNQLRSTYSGRTTVTTFYQVWNKPLVTLNNHHLISQLISLCGGSNVFANLPNLATQISIEAVLAEDPEVIIASGMGEERPDWLNDWLDWPNLKAVKRGHLFFIPPDIVQRHSPRVLEGARLLCEQLEQARSARE
ncbi:MAG: cobalamin-binding protein [Pseudomonadales bacterium]|nr:cobalamin-binding protein [Pseudomonadales bacterium]